ncbi:MAG: hypothetical protein ACKOEX_02580, partial [Planctomycetia bacterium]
MNDHASSTDALVLPAGLRRQLDVFRRTLWRIKALEAVGVAVFGVLVAWLVLFIADRLGDTSVTIRWILFVVSATCGAAIPFAVHRWIWRHRTLDRLARLIARRFPSLGDQLLGVVEIVRNRSEQQRSRSLCEAAIRQVADALGRQDLRDAVPRPRHLFWAGLAAVPLVVAAAAPWVFPEATANAWERLLAPWRSVERFTFTRVDRLPPMLVVPHGEEAEISVGLREDSRWRPDRAVTRIGRGPTSVTAREGDHYRFTVPPQAAEAPMRLAVGDARQRVTIAPTFRPEITAIEARVELPAYLERPEPITKDGRSGTVAVVKGSTAVITAIANRDLSTASVNGTTIPPDAASFSTQPVVVDAARQITLEWQDTLGLAGGKPLVVSLSARDDEPPTIVADGLSGRSVLLETETVRFMIRAKDDFGVKQVGIEWVGAAGIEEADRTSGERLLAAGDPLAETLEAAGTFSPVALGIAPQTVAVRGFVEDFFPGRSRVYTAPATFLVMSATDHALWVNDQIARWRQQTAEVRDREMELLAKNEDLRELEDDALDSPENRRALRDQAAAERANGRRLERLAESGKALVREAARNREFEAQALEKLAQQVQDLAEMADRRMPDIGQALDAAAEAAKETAASETAQPPSPPQPPSDTKPTRDGQKPDAGKAPSPPSVPQPSDTEDSAYRTEEPDPKDGEAPDTDGGGPSPLGLPTTNVGNVPAAGGPKKPSQRKLLDEAIDKQRKLLEDFAAIAEELADVMSRLEGTTFVKRLKAAARNELKVADSLASIVADTFGGSSKEKNDMVRRGASAATEDNKSVELTISTIMDDLDAYAERRPQPALRTVLEDMRTLDVLGSLRQLGNDMQKEPGTSIAQTEFWSDTFDRWADELVPPPQEGEAGEGEGAPPESLPPEIVLEAMLILEAETNLREETRVAEQVRGRLEAEAFRARADSLAGEQERLADRVAAIVEKLEGSPPGPARLFEKVESVMHDAIDILARPDTGRPAIAAETEAIELLLASQFGGG